MMIHIGEIERLLNRLENALKEALIVLLVCTLVGAVLTLGFHLDRTYFLVPLLFCFAVLSMLLQNCGIQVWLQKRILKSKIEDL